MMAVMTVPAEPDQTLPDTSPAPRRVWVDDRLLEADEASVSAVDHGLVVGDGVFESLKVTPAGAFALGRHLARMTRSAEGLGLPAPDHDRVREATDAVLADRPYELGLLRITWTGGAGPLGSQRAYGPPTLVLADTPVEPAPASTAVVTVPWTRNEHGAMTGVKTTSYAENVRALRHAYDRDATEGLFLNTAGHVCEGTGSNLFCVLDGEVVTSPLASGALAGITRELLLEWADVTERDLTLAEAQRADEVFLTSSLRDVQGVHRWDGVTFDAPGPVTRRLQQLFAERSAADPDPR